MKIEVADQAISEQVLRLEGIDFITGGDQYLTFTLGVEHYGLDILAVNEIRGWVAPTLIPNAPVHVKGVTNLRGNIVPVIDLRILFKVGEVEYSPFTVTIIVAIKDATVSRTMGFVVDAVSDVLNAEKSEIKSTPAFGGSVPLEYVTGLVNVGNNVVTLLNIKKLLNLDEDDVEH
jgi:purine-binding chemotaxis protein CheW